MDPSWSWYLKVVDLFNSPGIAPAIWAWGWSVIGAVFGPRWCGGTGTSVCYGYVNSMTSIWPLAKKPFREILVPELGIFQSFESFVSWSSRRFFGRKTFKVGIVVDYFVKPFFSRFCWWFLFPEKDKQVCFLLVDTKLHPIGGLVMGSFPTESKIPGLLNET